MMKNIEESGDFYERFIGLLQSFGEKLGYFKKKRKEQTLFVSVDLVPLDWVVEKDSKTNRILNLIPILESIGDEELYTTPFIDALKAATIILKTYAFDFCFIPFIIQIATSLFYFSLYVLREDQEISWMNYLLQVIVIIMSLYFLFIECLQFKDFHERGKRRHYFYSFTNFVDYTSVFTNLAIILNENLKRQLIGIKTLPYFVSYAVFCLWFRAFYWMRVFESSAFFIILIKKTLSGIRPFLILCIVIVVLFANILYIFNHSEHQINPLYHTTLYEDESGYSFTNAVIHIYLIALGEFNTADYGVRGAGQ